ncbi:IMP cyclohydrolase [Oscillospiraceae bacterium WX1]
MKTLTEALQLNTYPGRGILLGRSEDGNSAVLLYFIMGRSENSRNRVFVTTDDGIRTEAFDPAKMSDPSLIIYHPVRFFDNHVIVTNGDQTDTIWEGMKSGRGFTASLNTRTFEPDKPNYTPRISGLLKPDGAYTLSILKSHGGDPACCCRYFFDYETPISGVGHLIHTYSCDGDPIPSFEGEPKAVAMTGSLRDIADGAWRALNSDNKVSLYAFSKNLLTGETTNLIYNKNA